jgi:hypothetical protein
VGLLNSIAQVTDSKTRAKAYLAELFDDGTVDTSSVRAFQYYPETISDSRGVSYSTKDVIGGSHPIYQWTHGSERIISFSAIFATDYTHVTTVGNGLSTVNSALDILKNSVNAIGSALLGAKVDPELVNVSAAISWLRSKTYPDYPKGQVMSAPPRLILYLPGSGISSYVGPYHTDSIPCLIRSCNVEYEAFFNNGAPRIAVVSLEFAETIQVGQSWGFVSQSNVEVSWKHKDAKPGDSSGYNLGAGDTITTDTQGQTVQISPQSVLNAFKLF